MGKSARLLRDSRKGEIESNDQHLQDVMEMLQSQTGNDRRDCILELQRDPRIVQQISNIWAIIRREPEVTREMNIRWLL